MTDVTSLAAQNADYSTSTAASTKLASDLDSFLTLLTSQLKNQDPLSPMDSTEFTNQLVQFASVEQQIDTNKNMESLLGLTQSSISATAVSYIGKEVQAESTTLPLQEEGKDVQFTYTLTEDASKALMVIKDSSGNVVRSMSGDLSAGTHHMTWDGKDGDGNQLEVGAYTLEVQAEDTSGSDMENIYTTTKGIVTSVASDGDDVLIAAGPVLYKLSYIVSVSNPDTTSSDSDSSSSDSSSSDSSSSS